MSYQVLALKWRPQRFEEVVGQEHVTRTLQNAIREQRVPHAFLLTGSRGVGKTTSARILAKALVCAEGPSPEPCGKCSHCKDVTAGSSLDVLEIDGASNRGIDEIRDLREKARYAPASARLKIYIIDEVHMLTKEAFNALLKILEEPPPHVKFIFATTEINKVPITIQSRCQRFDFRLLSREEIQAQLKKIAVEEEIEISDSSLSTVAGAAEGSLRDGESLLDQVLAYSGRHVDDGEVSQALGLPEEETIRSFLAGLIHRKGAECLRILDRLASDGLDLKPFNREVLSGLRSLTILKADPELADLLAVPAESLEELRRLAGEASPGRLQALFEIFMQAEAGIRGSAFPRMLLELAVIKSVRLEEVEELRSLLKRLEEMEKNAPPEMSSREEREIPPAVSPPPAAPASAAGEPPAGEGAGAGDGAAASEDVGGTKEVRGTRKEIFRQLIRKVRKSRVLIASFLEHGKLEKIGESGIEIVFDSSNGLFLETLREAENFTSLKETVREFFQRPMEVKLTALEEEGEGRAEKKARESDLKKKRRHEALEQTIVQEALEVFQAQIDEVKLL